jgi:hypothetical protein
VATEYPLASREREAMQGLLTILSRLNVVPVLIGGRALAARGIPIDTTDFDLLLGCDQRVVHQVMIYLKEAGYCIDGVSEDAVCRGHSVELRCFSGEIQFDLIPVADPRLAFVHGRASAESWSCVEIRIARLVDVVIEKLRTGRVQDLMNTQTAIRELLSESERRGAMHDCRNLGLIETYRGFVETVFAH